MRKKQLLSVLAVVFCGLIISQASFAGTLALLDINRVTCTPQGKIFRSTPKVAL